MTTTLHRPSLPAPPSAASGPDPLRAGVPVAFWAFLAGLLIVAAPVLLGWAADSRSDASAGTAVAAVGQLFLLDHGAALTSATDTVDLLPLGLTLGHAWLLMRAGARAMRSCRVVCLGDAARLTGSIAMPYASLVMLLALLSGTDSVQPSAVEGVIGALLLASAAAGFGIVRTAGLQTSVRALVPDPLVRAAAGARLAVLALLGLGSALVGLSLAAHAGRATNLADAVSPGVLGGLLLLLVGLILLPVAAVWGACWILGAGFAVGAGTTVSPFENELGPVPSLPLLAALPNSAPPTWVAVGLLCLPVAVGVLAGIAVRRRGGGTLDALLVGPLAGLAMAGLAVLTAGPVGGGRLADLGPSFWLVGLLATVEIGAGALLAVVPAAVWKRKVAAQAP